MEMVDNRVRQLREEIAAFVAEFVEPADAYGREFGIDGNLAILRARSDGVYST